MTDALTDLFIILGVPAYIRSDNGPEFIADAVRQWIKAVGAQTAYIEPGSPWENGYCESFNARFRDKLLPGGKQHIGQIGCNSRIHDNQDHRDQHDDPVRRRALENRHDVHIRFDIRNRGFDRIDQ